MSETFRAFWLCFVPLFVAVDAVGVLPMFMGLTEGCDGRDIRRLVRQSVVTAAAVAIAFVAGGPTLLRWLNITVADFMIAGGALLFAISLSDMLRGERPQRQVDAEGLGAVPLGVPLITGPAVLTTSALLSDQYGTVITAVAIVINILIAGLVFWFSNRLYRLLGRAGSKTVSKIASLLLAAIAVMIVRRGFFAMIAAAASGAAR